jgi:hypothetical protein
MEYSGGENMKKAIALLVMIFMAISFFKVIYADYLDQEEEQILKGRIQEILTGLHDGEFSEQQALEEIEKLFQEMVVPNMDLEEGDVPDLSIAEPKIRDVFTMVTTALQGGGDFNSALDAAVNALASILTNPAYVAPGVNLPQATTPMIWIYDSNNNAIGNISINNGVLTIYDFTTGKVTSIDANVSDKQDFFNAMEKSPFWDQVFGNMDPKQREEVLSQLYEALVTGELGVGDKITIDGITFELVKEGQGARLDAYKDGEHYKMRHLDPSLTRELENSKGKSLDEAMNEKKGWSKKMKGDPAATGRVYYDEKEGCWKMEVEYWSNLEISNKQEKMTIKLNLDSFLDPEQKARVLAQLRKAAESGELITLYGATLDDQLGEGYTLDVLGLGKGDFQNHQLPEEKTAEELKNKQEVLDQAQAGYYPAVKQFYGFLNR